MPLSLKYPFFYDSPYYKRSYHHYKITISVVCIGHYESGLETDAVGTKGEEGSHDHGLFQAKKMQKNSKFVNIVLIDLRFTIARGFSNKYNYFDRSPTNTGVRGLGPPLPMCATFLARVYVSLSVKIIDNPN